MQIYARAFVTHSTIRALRHFNQNKAKLAGNAISRACVIQRGGVGTGPCKISRFYERRLIRQRCNYRGRESACAMGGNWEARARCGIILHLHFAAGLVGWLAGETDGLAVLWGSGGFMGCWK